MTEPLFALSVRQPFAWAIMEGWKDIENRSWPTKRRGTIALHASGNLTRSEYELFVQKRATRDRTIPDFEDLPRGAILGLVDIVDCVEKSRSQWFTGPFGFVLDNPRKLPEPIVCNGALSFWRVPDDIAAKIDAALARGSNQVRAG